MKRIIILAALLLAGCVDDPPPSAADRRRWEADSRADSSRRSAEYDAHRRGVQQVEKRKQDWIARGMPPPLRGDRQ
jgi:hypothetical protein